MEPRPNANTNTNANPKPDAPPESEPAKSYTWVKVLIVAVLVIGGIALVIHMQDAARLQDCVMQGRKNCTPPIDTTRR